MEVGESSPGSRTSDESTSTGLGSKVARSGRNVIHLDNLGVTRSVGVTIQFGQHGGDLVAERLEVAGKSGSVSCEEMSTGVTDMLGKSRIYLQQPFFSNKILGNRR